MATERMYPVGDFSGEHDFHKIMTMEDVAVRLSDSFEDELCDCKQYLHMAMIAEKSGNVNDCFYLREMAKDEYSHAFYIHNFMEEHSMCISEHLEMEFQELTEKMKPLLFL